MKNLDDDLNEEQDEGAAVPEDEETLVYEAPEIDEERDLDVPESAFWVSQAGRGELPEQDEDIEEEGRPPWDIDE